MGHYHRPARDTAHLYPGSPVPLAFGDPVDGGAVVIDLDADGSFQAEWHRVHDDPLCEVEVDLSTCGDGSEVRAAVDAALVGRRGVVRVVLSGELAPHVDLADADLRADDLAGRAGGIDHVHVLNRTRVGYDLDVLCSEAGVRGEFVRMVLADDELDTAERHRVVVTGLRAFDRRRDLEVVRVRFVTVHGDTFGLLRGSSLALGPGLNVVHGGNEAGKSTWLDALVVGLVGMRRGPGRRAAEAEFLARRRPWDDLEGDFGVRVVVELGDGRRVELGRDLAANVGTATDLTTGRPVEVPVFDGAHDGSRWLGLDRVTFPLVAAVRQTEVLAVRDDPGRMRDLLQRAATMSGDGVTAREALDTIETALREQVGVRRANAVRPLQRAVEAHARAEAASADARRRHDEQRELVAAASAAGEELRGLERLATVISTAIDRLAAAATVERHERAARLVTELDTLPSVPDTVADAARRSVEVVARVGARPARPSAAPRRAADIAAELDALPTLDDHDEQAHPSIVTAALLAEQAAAALAGHEAVPPARPAAAPEQIEQWRAWLDEVAVAGRAGPAPARPRRWRPLLGVAAALAGAGVLAVAAGWSAPGLALMAAAVAVAVARRAASRRGTSTTAGRAGGSAPEAGAARIGLVAAGFDPDDVGAGYDRLSRLALDAERFAEWRSELVGRRRDTCPPVPSSCGWRWRRGRRATAPSGTTGTGSGATPRRPPTRWRGAARHSNASSAPPSRPSWAAAATTRPLRH